MGMCSILDDHVSPRRSALFMARSVLRDDGTFDVLYTSVSRSAALEEMRFHLMRGQPVMPSKVRYRVFEMGSDAGGGRILR